MSISDFLFFLVRGELVYNIMLVSLLQQCKSVIIIYIYILSVLSFPPLQPLWVIAECLVCPCCIFLWPKIFQQTQSKARWLHRWILSNFQRKINIYPAQSFPNDFREKKTPKVILLVHHHSDTKTRHRYNNKNKNKKKW